MPVVKVIHPILTDEERAKRLARVDEALEAFWRKMKQIEEQTQQKARSQHLQEERSKQKCRKRCELCGEVFYANSGRTLYCEHCKETGHEMNKRRDLDRQSAKYRAETLRKYAKGVTYVCDVCGRTIMVHERTSRHTCDECLSKMGAAGRQRIMCRKPIDEEVIENA